MPEPARVPSEPAGDPHDYWLDGPALARWLGFHRTTLLRLRRQGLPCVGAGRLRRYHVPEVLAWLRQHT